MLSSRGLRIWFRRVAGRLTPVNQSRVVDLCHVVSRRLYYSGGPEFVYQYLLPRPAPDAFLQTPAGLRSGNANRHSPFRWQHRKSLRNRFLELMQNSLSQGSRLVGRRKPTNLVLALRFVVSAQRRRTLEPRQEFHYLPASVIAAPLQTTPRNSSWC